VRAFQIGFAQISPGKNRAFEMAPAQDRRLFDVVAVQLFLIVDFRGF
jgi:hypothetical protein